MSVWAKWTDCTLTCGSGKKTRIRTKLVEESNGGKCEEDLLEEEECNTKPCPEPCKWAEWQDWDDCSQSCGTGKKVRVRVKELKEKNGGLCKGSYREESTCNTNLCPIPCKWGAWSKWGPCSATCGNGERTKTRGKELVEKHGGSCDGDFTKTGTCNIKSCPQPCQVGKWKDWSDCSKTCGGGKTTRTREKVVEESNGGKCAFDLIEEKSCQKHACPTPTPSPQPCQVGKWKDWSDCSKTCGGGKTTRTREKEVEESNGGECAFDLIEEKSCQTHACPTPTPSPECHWQEWGDWKTCNESCDLSKWGEWIECSRTCGKGKRIRSRFIQGPECIDFAEQAEECNLQSCDGKRILCILTST